MLRLKTRLLRASNDIVLIDQITGRAPCQFFSIGVKLNVQCLVDYFKKHLKQMKIITQLKLDHRILDVITHKISIKILIVFRYLCAKFSKSTQFLPNLL